MPRKTEAPSVADVTTHLRDVKYPAGRDDLLRCAEANRAPGTVLAVIRELEDRVYGGVAEVSQSLEGVLIRLGKHPEEDAVEKASEESFPASDAPGYPSSGHIGAPHNGKKKR